MAHRLPALALIVFVLFAANARTQSARSETSEPVPESVVLLHGLWRSDWSMRRLSDYLERAGFDVHNVDYASNHRSPDELVAELHAEVGRCCEDAARLHFVTHSLGGIVTRAYLARHRPRSLGRVVMLAPPNHGSEYVDEFGEAFGWILGPTGRQLGTDAESLPNRLPPPDFELGVIAGTRSHNPVSELIIDGEHDGTVSVESTRLLGMQDFIQLATTHTFIMNSEDAMQQTLHFLRNGRFAPPRAAE